MNNKKGVALFLSLTVLLLLSIAAIVVLLTAYNYSDLTEGQIDRLEGIALAEAGIHYAYYELRQDPDGFAATTPVSIQPDSSGPSVEITVTGGPFPAQFTVKSKVTY